MLRALLSGWLLLAALQAQTTPAGKVGVVRAQDAILRTRDGQKAFNDLQKKLALKKAELDKRRADIAELQDQLQKDVVMSADLKRRRARDIDRKIKAVDRDTEDAQGNFEQEQAEVSHDLDQKLRTVVDQYAKDNGFAVILEASNPQTPAYWWSNAVDITDDIVTAYDKASPRTAPR